MRSKKWKSCCQRWTSKMIEKVKNTTNNVLLRMEFYKFKKKSTIWWKNWWKRVDAKGGAGHWRQIRSFAVLQIVPLLLAGKGSRLAWKYSTRIRKTTFFPNFENSYCKKRIILDASPDQATRIFALVERAHWKKITSSKERHKVIIWADPSKNHTSAVFIIF